MATAACLIRNKSRVLWVPEHEGASDTAGSWLSANQACLLPHGSDMPNQCVINVGRRAGLNITDAPDHVTKV